MTTNKETVIAAISGEKKNLKAIMWVRKAGGIEFVTEEMAARIVKLCRLQEPQGEGKGK